MLLSHLRMYYITFPLFHMHFVCGWACTISRACSFCCVFCAFLKSTTSSRQEASQRKANDPSASVVNNNKSTNRHSMLTTASNEMNVLHRSNSWIKKNGDSILWRDEMLSINSINNLSSNDINDKLLIKCLDSKCESNQPDSNKRHIILKVIQTKARLSAKQKKVEHPHYELSHVIGKNQAHQQHQFELSLPIKNSSPLVLPLPIPQVSS